MYSWEIDNYLRDRNYVINKNEYMNIADVRLSSQISRVKYDAYSNSFYMETKDGYNWTFWIKE